MTNRTGYNLSDTKDLASLILKIIDNAINNNINMPFIARVTAVKNNKVDVMPLYTLTFNNLPIQPSTYYNILVGLPLTGKAYINNPIQVGDIGLCIVTDRDITTYADTGTEGPVATQRRFNKMDSVFIPLSMYKQSNMAQSYIFTYFGAPETETLKLEISQNNTIDLVGGQDGNAYKINIDEQGNISININNESITISLNTDDGISFKDSNNNSILIDSEGINITDANNNNVLLDSEGINITDANNNNVLLDSQGINITDANNNTIKMANSGVTIQDANGNKIDLGASGININNGALSIMV